MSESARKLLERLVSNVLRVHGLQFQKNLHGGMIQGFLVELFHEKVMVSRKQLEKEVKPKLLDIADMPNCSLKVKDGLHSVSEGKIFWTPNNKVTCREHGACNCVNKERTIWRCLTCHEGAYIPERDFGSSSVKKRPNPHLTFEDVFGKGSGVEPENKKKEP